MKPLKQNLHQFYTISKHIRRHINLEYEAQNTDSERCKVGRMTEKLYKNAVFCDFLVITEGKSRCYMSEICK